MISSLMAECIHEYCLDMKDRPPTQTKRCDRCGDTYLVEYKVIFDPGGARRKVMRPHRKCYPRSFHEYMELPGLRRRRLQHFPISLIWAAGRWILPPAIERVRHFRLSSNARQLHRCASE